MATTKKSFLLTLVVNSNGNSEARSNLTEEYKGTVRVTQYTAVGIPTSLGPLGLLANHGDALFLIAGNGTFDCDKSFEGIFKSGGNANLLEMFLIMNGNVCIGSTFANSQVVLLCDKCE